jgi:hypothetical protein
METILRRPDDRNRHGMTRPKRRAIPKRVKMIVAVRQAWLCKCGCGLEIGLAVKSGTQWDHEPALRLRDIAPDGKDYIPPQHDPDYIDARCESSHAAKTHGSGATTAGSDIGKIKKERARSRKPKFKMSWGVSYQAANFRGPYAKVRLDRPEVARPTMTPKKRWFIPARNFLMRLVNPSEPMKRWWIF